MTIWKKVFRDPIFHFSLIGGTLFMADIYSGDAPDQIRMIEVDQAQIEWMKSASEKEVGRLPTDQELESLIDNFVREEVYFREALAMGLQREDVIVRRRLVQKLRFLVEDVATAQPPSDQKLRGLFNKMQDNFQEPARYSFSHFYFRNTRKDARSDARQSLDQLQFLAKQAKANKSTANNATTDEPPKHWGDSFMMRYHYVNQDQRQIANNFGGSFAASVAGLPAGQWRGPFKSAYGWHLVKLSDKRDSYIPDFDEVSESVLAHWHQQQRDKANEEAFARLQKSYQIEIHKTQES